MALETEIQTLTAAITDLTKAVNILTAKAKAEGVSTASEKKAAPAEDEDDAATEKPARKTRTPRGEKTEEKPVAKGKAFKPLAVDAMKALATSWLNEVADQNEEYAARRAVIGKITAKFEAGAWRNIAPEDQEEAIKLLDKAKEEAAIRVEAAKAAKDTPEPADDEDEDDI